MEEWNSAAFWFGLPWGDAAGHISYLIIAISYWLTNIYWLRVTAVVGLAFEVAYFVIVSDALYTGIAWDLIFIAINLFHMLRLTHERLRLRLAADDRDMLRIYSRGWTMRRSAVCSAASRGTRRRWASSLPPKAFPFRP
jgi:hypothetical protein